MVENMCYHIIYDILWDSKTHTFMQEALFIFINNAFQCPFF